MEKKQSLAQTNRIIHWIGADEKRFGELVKLFFAGDYRITQRAGWPMSYCIREHPEMARSYLKKFMGHLSDTNSHPAARRNIVRLLQFIEVPKRYQGKLMNACFQFIGDPQEAIAVKAFSLTILDGLSSTYPEILPEIKSIIEARWNFETPAFHSRARKILRKME